jgi:predicted nucleic acid-binding protein
MPDAIFDTTALSNFAAAGRIDLLESRFRGRAFVTAEVADELRSGVNAGYTYLNALLDGIDVVNPAGWLCVLSASSPEEHRLRAEFDLLLDPGEASCLALAISKRLTLVTDDLAARRLASEHHVALSGTVGILIALTRSGDLALSDANGMLAGMIQRGYRSPVERLDGFT